MAGSRHQPSDGLDPHFPPYSQDERMFFDDDDGIDAASLTNQSLIDTQERMGLMLDVMPMGLLIHTQQGIVYANQEAARLLSVSQNTVVGRHFLDFVSARAAEASQQIDCAFAGMAAGLPTEIQIGDNAQTRTIKLIAGLLPWQGNSVIQLLLQDITDLKRTEETLRRLTITDELTGANNRRHAFCEASGLVRDALANQSSFSAAVLDIDFFKKINDQHGHASGDVALKKLVEVCNGYIRSSRPNALLARIGGEEFLILMRDTAIDSAIAFAEGLRQEVAGCLVPLINQNLTLTVSIGVAEYRAGEQNFDETFSRADEALYEAKRTGRNRVKAASLHKPACLRSA